MSWRSSIEIEIEADADGSSSEVTRSGARAQAFREGSWDTGTNASDDRNVLHNTTSNPQSTQRRGEDRRLVVITVVIVVVIVDVIVIVIVVVIRGILRERPPSKRGDEDFRKEGRGIGIVIVSYRIRVVVSD